MEISSFFKHATVADPDKHVCASLKTVVEPEII